VIGSRAGTQCLRARRHRIKRTGDAQRRPRPASRRAGQGAGDGGAQFKRSNMGKTPEQSQRDDRNYGDHTEISELLSDGLVRLHFSTL
jgi:hypothetical protein